MDCHTCKKEKKKEKGKKKKKKKKKKQNKEKNYLLKQEFTIQPILVYVKMAKMAGVVVNFEMRSHNHRKDKQLESGKEKKKKLFTSCQQRWKHLDVRLHDPHLWTPFPLDIPSKPE